MQVSVGVLTTVTCHVTTVICHVTTVICHVNIIISCFLRSFFTPKVFTKLLKDDPLGRYEMMSPMTFLKNTFLILPQSVHYTVIFLHYEERYIIHCLYYQVILS